MIYFIDLPCMPPRNQAFHCTHCDNYVKGTFYVKCSSKACDRHLLSCSSKLRRGVCSDCRSRCMEASSAVRVSEDEEGDIDCENEDYVPNARTPQLGHLDIDAEDQDLAGILPQGVILDTSAIKILLLIYQNTKSLLSRLPDQAASRKPQDSIRWALREDCGIVASQQPLNNIPVTTC